MASVGEPLEEATPPDPSPPAGQRAAEDRFFAPGGQTLALPSAVPTAEPSSQHAPFRFVQLADTQLGMAAAMHKMQWLRKVRCALTACTCGCVDAKQLVPVPRLLTPGTAEELNALELELSKRAVKAINALQPRPTFAVVCGDLVNGKDKLGTQEHQDATAAFKQVFSDIHEDISLVCLCGNHDVGDRPTPTTIAAWKGHFGDDYFSFFVSGVKFIVINSQYLKDGTGAPEEAAAQEAWLDLELSAGKEQGQQIVVFSHHPPFINDPEEPDGYFALGRTTRLRLLGKMARAGVTTWMCGHYHRNAGGFYSTDGAAPTATTAELTPLTTSNPEGTGTTSGDGASEGTARASRLEVITTAAAGANFVTDESADELDMSGMGGINVDGTVSGLRVVDVDASRSQDGGGGLVHRFFTLAELEQ